MGNQEAFLVVEKSTIGGFKVRIRGVTLSGGMSKLGVDSFAVFVIRLVHGVGPKFWGMGGIAS